MIAAPELASAKPYLLRAMYEWCTDQGLTPYASVFVDDNVHVPMEFVKDHAITLNIGADATGSLSIGSETLEFKARFGGIARQIVVPITNIMAIYGRENGQGMAFPIASPEPQDLKTTDVLKEPVENQATALKKEVIKPTLTRVK
jgi:stringent starvation protein B